jgi:hypothetical protein
MLELKRKKVQELKWKKKKKPCSLRMRNGTSVGVQGVGQ